MALTSEEEAKVKAIIAAFDGAQQVADGASDLSTGASQAYSGAKTLSSGLGDLDDGAQELATGTDTLTDGLHTLSYGATALDDGISQLADGADTLATGLSSGVKQIPVLTDDEIREAELAEGFAVVRHIEHRHVEAVLLLLGIVGCVIGLKALP